MVHIQRMLREPPHTSIGGILDTDVEPMSPDATLGRVTRYLANYNLVGVPVVDDAARLVGAVTVDDVLDHILPEDWRETDDLDAAEIDADRDTPAGGDRDGT